MLWLQFILFTCVKIDPLKLILHAGKQSDPLPMTAEHVPSQGCSRLTNGQKQRLALKATALAMGLNDIETAVEDCPVNIIRVDPT